MPNGPASATAPCNTARNAPSSSAPSGPPAPPSSGPTAASAKRRPARSGWSGPPVLTIPTATNGRCSEMPADPLDPTVPPLDPVFVQLNPGTVLHRRGHTIDPAVRLRRAEELATLGAQVVADMNTENNAQRASLRRHAIQRRAERAEQLRAERATRPTQQRTDRGERQAQARAERVERSARPHHPHRDDREVFGDAR